MQDVRVDRNKYIGGSDIPIIMNIGPFKKRFDLLLEKAELKENDFNGNEYTEYGNVMEEKIRSFINESYGMKFKEGKHIENDIRCHTDGETSTTILEIKTTSQVHETIDEYKIYLVQLLFYMEHTKRNKGMLAVYHRPEDFNEEFDSKRLQVFAIEKDNYKDLVEEIDIAVNKFREDLKKVKENPLITEEELLPVNVTEIALQVETLENQLIEYDQIVKERDELKSRLKKAMEDNRIKSWETVNGTKITLVADGEDKEVEEEYYDEEKFIKENPELHQQYHNKLAEYKEIKKVIKKGKKGYVKVTLPKKEVEA